MQCTTDDVDLFLGIPGLMSRLPPASISTRKALQTRTIGGDIGDTDLRIPQLAPLAASPGECTPTQFFHWDPATARADASPLIRGDANPTAPGPRPCNRLVKVRGVPTPVPIGLFR